MKNSTVIVIIAVGSLLGACATKSSAPTSSARTSDPRSPVLVGDQYGSRDASATASLAGLQHEFTQAAGDVVYFEFDSYALSGAAKARLEDQARWLNDHPTVQVLLAGRCDDRGTRTYNLALGARRSSAARAYLVSQGLRPERLSTVSYGKERPEALGDGEGARALNRNARSVLIGLAER
jgi:peptidoglycan-associated lipoprotein